MKNIKYQLSIINLLLLLAITACNPNYDMPGMFNGSSERADKRLAESLDYDKKVGEIHLTVPEDYTVYVCTDTHVDSTTHNWEKFVKLYKADAACPFALHLGDLINAKGNFGRFFNAAKVAPAGYVSGKDTMFSVVGNHDLYFNQWPEYKSFVGTSTYWFDTRTADGTLLDLYICLDSGEGTLGVDGLKWLSDILQEKAEKKYRHIIVFTHTHMFKQDDSQGHTSNYSMEETYEIASLLTKYGVAEYWSGHDHSREMTTYGKVKYIVVDALEDPVEEAFFMKVRMGKNIEHEFVDIKD